MKHKTQKMTET